MPVEIITGQIGSGKTEYCINGIRELHKAEPQARCVMLVPSHYSHETEKLLIDEFGGTGLNNIEVTSFEKLARTLMSGTERYLAAPGKQALICRAVDMCLDELEKRHGEFDSRLIAAVRKPGFLDIASSLVSELRRYMIPAEELRANAENIENGILRQKLEITVLIAESYDKLMSGTDYADSDEDLLRVAGAVGELYDRNTHIWIDKFDEFLPQQAEVVRSLIDLGLDIRITFNVCSNYEDTYYGTVSAIEKLREYAPETRLTHLEGGMRHLSARPDLRFLFTTWFDRDVYTGRVENAEVFEARDTYSEIEHIACRILDLAREDKYRFRDMAVICGDRDGCAHIIKAVFDEYGIPYYSDETVSIADHPIAMQILSLFDIIEHDWDYASMFEYLRAGFVYTGENIGGRLRYRRIPDSDIDALENYVLKYGIRGRNRWSRPWNKGHRNVIEEAFGQGTDEVQSADEQAEKLRKLVAEPILGYCEAVKESKTVSDHCRALYSFIESIDLYGGLKAELLGMAVNMATADAQRFGQIWNLVLDVLDQLNTALGETETDRSGFFGYMRAAMTKCEIRTIPSGVDRVFIGSVEKNQSSNVKVLFMAGAVTGTFPSESGIEGFLSNSDREYLDSVNIKLAPTTVKKAEKQYHQVYKALSAVTDRLCVSYTVQTPEGRSCRASQTVLDICAKLKEIKRYTDSELKAEEDHRLYISTPKATLHKLLIHSKAHPLWKHVSDWFYEHGEWRGRMFAVSRTKKSFANREISLSPKLAGQMYKGQIMYSPTRLNSYAQCPFKYFMEYGLRAKPREEWELSAADTGTYAHELIRRLFEQVESDPQLDWDSVTDEQCAAIIDLAVAESNERILGSGMTDREQTASVLRRTGAAAKEAAKAVRRSIAAGSFKTESYEMSFETALSETAGIKGTIDRLDVCRHDGRTEYRIIDYKTGKKDFKLTEIYNGLSMQPVIYAVAVCMLNEGAEISGTYYSIVRNDFAVLTTSNGAAQIEKKLKENTRISGATFVDVDKDGNIDEASLERIEAAENREGIFFKPGKGGAVSIGGNLRSMAAGRRLMDITKEKIIETDRRIRGGDIAISPAVTGYNSTACGYCEYAAACRFDDPLKCGRDVTGNDDDIWKILEEDE